MARDTNASAPPADVGRHPREHPLRSNNGIKSFAIVVVLFLLLSWFQLDPGSDGDNVATGGEDIGAGPGAEVDLADGVAAETGRAGTGPAAGPGRKAGVAGSGAQAGASGSGPQAGVPPARAFECSAGKNGGVTDKGVSGNKIRLATTAVLDGPAKTLLEDSVVAIKSVIDKVNKAGGVCGRLLDLRVVNDSFRDNVGLQTIKSFIAEDYFALPVVPSAEGLGAAILSGEIRKAGIPVVGTDGMRQEQYGDPYVWPVASATVTAMRVMAKYGATARDAKTFAIVWDQKYKFGREGADAFKAQVKAMGFGNVVADFPLDPEKPSYAEDVARFNDQCDDGAKCDMVAMLLLPDTAKKWLQRSPAFGRLYTAGAQTLFTDRFAQDCVLLLGDRCQGFGVWTGYNPPIGPLAALPGVAAYVNDVKAVKSDIDVNNQFIEGAYLGMTVFVEALKKVGPDLTRARLRAVMDAMDLQTDLASTLQWRPGNHSANVRSQSFSMTVSGGAFRGWSNENTGFLLDPAAEG
jgi:branched-chain amino acid transport system substrate-binding protein